LALGFFVKEMPPFVMFFLNSRGLNAI